MTPIGERRGADLGGRLRAALAARWLAERAERHRADGIPALAIFAFDHVGRAVELWGRYERDELELLMQCLRGRLAPGGIALDVGANIGNHALFFAPHFDEVWAFEPNPRIGVLLALNATLAPNVRCFDVGLSDRAGDAMLTVPEGNAGMATLAPGAPGRAVPVRLQRLDDLAGLAARRVALVKIDVEGHEAAVLRGARALLARDRPVVVFEQAAHEIAQGRSAALDELRTGGYARWWIVEAFPSGGTRLGRLLRRALQGEGLRMLEVDELPSRFHSMVVALPGPR
jgi:FkbM family methyltransferase